MKVKILHVINVSFSIPIFFNGQFNYFSNLQQTYLACSKSDDFYNYSKSYGFEPIQININRKISPIRDIICLFQLYFHIKKNNIEIVVGHTPKAALLAMISGYFAKTKKRIYFKHGLLFETQLGLNKYLLIAIEKITEYFSSEIICVSESLIKNSILYKLGNSKKYKLLNKGTCNGINTTDVFNPDLYDLHFKMQLRKKYNIDRNDIVIGFVGRLAIDKGINELIQAWEIIEKKYKNAYLILLGPIDERDPININPTYSTKNLIRIDYVSNPAPFYAIFDIFILPSYREGFPTVNLEAAAMNLPIITTRKTGCIDSIIDKKTGIFTEINSKAISNAIEYYIINPEQKEIHGDNGRKFVSENFSQILVWDCLSKIYFN